MTKIIKHNESQKSLALRTKDELGVSNTLNDLIYCDTEPSFALLRRDHGKTDVRLMLLAKMQLMLKRVGGALNDEQVEYLIDDILLKEFWYYNISDLNLIERRIASLKIYGKVKIQDIVSVLEAYDVERTKMAMHRKDVEDKDTEAKNTASIPPEVKERLHAMLDRKIIKGKVDKINNPPPLSDEAIKANADRLRKIKKQFPNLKI